MSELATLARPYAQAIFDLSEDKNSLDKWADQLAFLSAVVSDLLFIRTLHNPRIGKSRLDELMTSIAADRLSNEGHNLIKLLIRNRRVGLLPQIAEIFEFLRAEREGYIETNVRSAYSLSDQELKALTEALSIRFNKSIKMRIYEDRSLIGGVHIRAGDKVIDGSIKGQLQNLAKRL